VLPVVSPAPVLRVLVVISGRPRPDRLGEQLTEADAHGGVTPLPAGVGERRGRKPSVRLDGRQRGERARGAVVQAGHHAVDAPAYPPHRVATDGPMHEADRARPQQPGAVSSQAAQMQLEEADVARWVHRDVSCGGDQVR
jgi:hypothetical protein